VEKEFSKEWKTMKKTFERSLILFFLILFVCYVSEQKVSGNSQIRKKITISDLYIPIWEKGQLAGRQPLEILWDTTVDPAIEPAEILQVCLAEYWNKGDNIQITKSQFRDSAIIPYINGLWTSTATLLRTPEMVGQMAMDKLINPSVHPEDPGFPGWPVYFPSTHPFVYDIIVAHNTDGTKLDIKSLPARKPAASSNEGHELYNNLGLLYLPNAYVVPGGTFNEMYGWDSFFIIIGMLKSAEYIMENPDSKIYVEGVLRTAGREDAGTLFEIAKGMVDNHIYEINFYGGYVLNANRSYYLTRSQPPLFTQEALAVYDFQKRYGTQLNLKYQETLVKYLETSYPDLQTPTSFDEWMTIEVIPAAITYYDYWTGPDTVYENWIPSSSGDRKNSRVVNVAESGNECESNTEKSYIAYRYYTDGVGGAPEVINSTQPQNSLLYTNAAAFFQQYPEHNPTDPDTGKGMFWNEESIYFANLTQKFYASDRAVRATGFDLSIRYGMQGEYATNYAPTDLNTLLYQMGKDLILMLGQFGCRGKTVAEIISLTSIINERIENGKEVINNLLWVDSENRYSDLRIGDYGKAVKYPYEYGTSFYPLWAQDLITSVERFQSMVKSATARKVVGQNELVFVSDDSNGSGPIAIKWFNEPGKIYAYDSATGETTWEKAKASSFLTSEDELSTKTASTFGIPTSLVQSGNQWDYPYVWAPVQYFAMHGIANHGIDKFPVAEIALNNILEGWMEAADIFFAKTGYLVEKYTSYDPTADKRVSHGYSNAQIGFGWTNAVYMDAHILAEKLFPLPVPYPPHR